MEIEVEKKEISKFKKYTFIVYVIASLILIFISGYFGYNQQNVEGLLKGYLTIAPYIFILFIAFASATTMPISVTLIPGILLFSFWYTILYAFIGIILGASFVYFFTKYTGKNFVNEYAELKGGRLKAFNRLLHKNSFDFVLVLNLVYFFPSNLAHMAAGVTHLKFHKFVFAAMLGNYLNFFSVTLLLYGFLKLNYYYVASSIAMLVLITSIPLLIYRRHLKELFLIAFNKK